MAKPIQSGKEEIKQAIRAAFHEPILQAVAGIEPLSGIYVKAFTAKEFRDILAQHDDFDNQYTDGYNEERRLILEIFDEQGRQLFSPDDLQDVLALAEIPYSIRVKITNASYNLNLADGLKKALATEKSAL